MRKLTITLTLLILLAIAAAQAAADGPVLWKQHCPAHYDVQIVPADDWGGVHVLCIRAAEERTR